MDILDQLAKSTVKINCDNNSTGTGFFFHFKLENDITVPTIITNRHVIEGVNNLKIILSKNDYFQSASKIVEKFEVDYSDVQNSVIYHSNPSIDLCAIVITNLIEYQLKGNLYLDVKNLTMDNVPSDEELEKLRFVEDIMMIGYPNGISDEKNNLPIFRNGKTASHPGVDFNGNSEFVVDMTITPGSSGSPVFIYNSSGYKEKNGSFNLGAERLIFLGINKAVFIQNNYGEIVEIPSPTKLVSQSQIGINLGLIIKARELQDIQKQLEKVNKLNK